MCTLRLDAVSWSLAVAASLLIVLSVLSSRTDADTSTTHSISMTVMEVKGATTADKLSPPDINPKSLSGGYGYKGPGEVDKDNPGKWQVSSYLFVPDFVTIKQGDKVKLTIFVVNGNGHDVVLTDPDGRVVMESTTWRRGREYKVEFKTKKAGSYRLTCMSHPPTMTATFYVLPGGR